MKQRFFTANHKRDNVIRNSSSGGVFTALTDTWFSQYKEKAVVYGCVSDGAKRAKHVRATSSEQRDLMRGSKYIASDLTGIFPLVIEDLKNGMNVFFSGTPCQVAGLKSFLSVSAFDFQKQLITLEVVCHGVGSNKFFEDYISHLEKRYKSRAVKCKFRAKSRPGKSEDMEVLFENGKKYNSATTKYDWFYSAYIKNHILRPSCYSCPYAKIEREADICISDNWKDFYSDSENKHLSAVIVCSESGLKLLNMSTESLNIEEKDAEGVYQDNLYNPSSKPENNDKFRSVYINDGYLEAQRFLGNHSVKGYIRYFIVYLLDCLNLIETVKKVKNAIKSVDKRK